MLQSLQSTASASDFRDGLNSATPRNTKTAQHTIHSIPVPFFPGSLRGLTRLGITRADLAGCFAAVPMSTERLTKWTT